MNHRLTLTAAAASVLASTALFQLILGGKWFWGGIGAVILVAGVGAVTRLRALRGVPPIACLVAALAVLLLYLNLVYASSVSFGGVAPTAASLTHLWSLVRSAKSDMDIYSPPVPDHPGIVLLATAGIGAIAALTDLIAVRLRRSALAGLPLLALFSVPVASGADKNSAETAALFCLGMAGYLALLSADGRERLRLWGRLVTPWQPAAEEGDDGQGAPNTRALAASGRRIGLAAVALALFVPLIIPGLGAHKLAPGNPNGNGSGTSAGTGPGQLPDPLVEMTSDLQEGKPKNVLSYHTSLPASQHPPNLQIYALNNLTTDTGTLTLTGQGVQLGRSGAMPAVPGLKHPSRWRTITTSISVGSGTQAPSTQATFVPMPYPARTFIPADGWKADPDTLMAYSNQSLSGLDYLVTSEDVDPSQQLLESSGAAPALKSDLTVPQPLDSLLGYAKQVTRGATSTYAKAEALQSWFSSRGHFKYSLNVPKSSDADALKSFLHNKTGYCQQFAFAMAILARLLHIPSRVAVGFTAGTSLGHGNWQVRTSDAHAWTELYFAGLGWLSWEPTPPGTAVGQDTAVAPSYTVPAGTTSPGGGGSTTPSGGSTGSGSRATGRLALGLKRQIPQDVGSGADGVHLTPPVQHSGTPPVLFILLAVLLAVALVGPRVTRSFTSRRRWLVARDDTTRAHAAWLELLDDLADYGIGHGPGETPRAVASRVTTAQKLSRPATEAVQRLAQAEERARYARTPVSSEGLPADVSTVRRAVSDSVRPTARWQARLWPASALERSREVLSHAFDLFGWAEVAAARIRGRLTRSQVIDQG